MAGLHGACDMARTAGALDAFESIFTLIITDDLSY